MTGGRVVILGKTGRNFAAGMSGGIAYVYDQQGNFKDRCNLEMVELEEISREDEEAIKGLLTNHYQYTASLLAKNIVDNFPGLGNKFVKVMPKEYQRILEKRVVRGKMELTELSDG